MPERHKVKAGFSPTVDCAVLVAAAEKGFAADEGIELQLVRKQSARSVLAALDGDEVQVAHLPAPVPVGSAVGLDDLPGNIIGVFTLSLGGSATTVSHEFYDELYREGLKLPDPAAFGRAMARVCAARRASGGNPPVFAVEDIISTPFYTLRYLLGSCGVLLGRDMEIVEALPKAMPGLLESGKVDALCTAEPAGSALVLGGAGRIVTTGALIWHNAPEKILATRRPWAEANSTPLEGLLRALYRAGEWCANPANIEELTGILAAPHYIGANGEFLLPALTGYISTSLRDMQRYPEFFVTNAKAANFPWQSQALWFFSQMLRWGEVPADRRFDAAVVEAARNAYRPDIFRKAMKPLFVPVPGANLKLEGTLREPVHVGASRTGLVLGPDCFFDGRVFDPETLDMDDEI
ncbi:CmpA/NrtA family ABC transporter substrate-binding protein [Agrobacterium tumefaciens]|uniref:CmpA/NrtA family ABC transporter substrate-binding protein n=1 Tax=Agrobacterium tumefaciens TaxID=358 RepID=UPI00045A345F|nr:CmpA/NrtA family ABC transporter substrate-binding protein [Agrobacterium tumefaciens]CDN91682.1 ABC transporter, nucleotide binding/ATPase protein [Agrobacterium tumefaciens]